jgi:oligoendopeptidase F
MKVKWNLSLLYKSSRDRNVERDMRAIERAYSNFERQYKSNKSYLKTETSTYRALCDYEKLLKKVAGIKPYRYFDFRMELDSNDKYADSMINKLSERISRASNRVLFFEIALGQLDEQTKTRLLKSRHLAKFRYFLEVRFEQSRHDLSECEERILSLKSLTSKSLWVRGAEKMLNSQTVNHNGKSLPLSEASNLVPSLRTMPRRNLQKHINEKLKSISDFSESEMNAIILDKKIDDSLRKFDEPYSQTVLNYENSKQTVTNLVKAVSDGFGISHRFYRIKSKILKLKPLHYADRAVLVNSAKNEYSYVESYNRLYRILKAMDSRYAEILSNAAVNGQIDVYPKKCKSGGAFCAGTSGLPTFVLLNHVNDLRSFTTLAHEIGHAIHTERSKQQGVMYEHYTTSVAEVASTFFEAVALDAVISELGEREKIAVLHNKIQEDIATVFRQVAAFNFELELHNSVRDRGMLSRGEMAKLLVKHMRKYLGKSVQVSDLDGYAFVSWSHFRRFFYVYSYAYGQLVSRALYERYKKDDSFIEQIDKFLSAGGSDTPENIFKSIGIDTSSAAFFKEGLKVIDTDIKELEMLVK